MKDLHGDQFEEGVGRHRLQGEQLVPLSRFQPDRDLTLLCFAVFLFLISDSFDDNAVQETEQKPIVFPDYLLRCAPGVYCLV